MALKKYFCPLRPNFSVGGSDVLCFRNHTLELSDPRLQRVIESHPWFGEHIRITEVDGEVPREMLEEMYASASRVIERRNAERALMSPGAAQGPVTSSSLRIGDSKAEAPKVEPQPPFTVPPSQSPSAAFAPPDAEQVLTMPKRGLQDVLRGLRAAGISGATMIDGRQDTEKLRDELRRVLEPIWGSRPES
jgi:hypothetical protein